MKLLSSAGSASTGPRREPPSRGQCAGRGRRGRCPWKRSSQFCTSLLLLSARCHQQRHPCWWQDDEHIWAENMVSRASSGRRTHVPLRSLHMGISNLLPPRPEQEKRSLVYQISLKRHQITCGMPKACLTTLVMSATARGPEGVSVFLTLILGRSRSGPSLRSRRATRFLVFPGMKSGSRIMASRD